MRGRNLLHEVRPAFVVEPVPEQSSVGKFKEPGVVGVERLRGFSVVVEASSTGFQVTVFAACICEAFGVSNPAAGVAASCVVWLWGSGGR